MKRYLPTQLCVVSYPDIFEPGQGRTNMNKRHNSSVKEALKKCLLFHHKHNVPRHFQFGAHAKYRYQKRSDVTLLIKSKRGKKYLDLVLSGKAKQKFTKSYNRLRVGGATYNAGGAVTATMTIAWPPGYYDNPRAKPGSVTKATMRDEIEKWTEQEQVQMGQHLIHYYVEEMKKRVRAGGRLTKKFRSQLQAQGVV